MSKIKITAFVACIFGLAASFYVIASELRKMHLIERSKKNSSKRDFILRKVEELQSTANHMAKFHLYDEAKEWLLEAKRLLEEELPKCK